jgi:hypothetical protein
MKTRRYNVGGEIQEKINKLQKLMDSPTTPESDKKNFADAIEKFKVKLKEEKEKKEEKSDKKEEKSDKKETSKPKASAKAKPTPKKTEQKKDLSIKRAVKGKTEKKVPKGIQLVSRKKVIIDGKELNTDSKEFCDYLTDEFIKRREEAKKNKGKRKKTKSVMAQVTEKIEKGIEKAIKTGITNQKPSLKNNPKVFIGKVQKLETATKNFLQQLKDVLGNDYEAKEVSDTTKAINDLIEQLKKKYIKK